MSATTEPLVEYRILTPRQARRARRRRITRRAVTTVITIAVILIPSPLRYDYIDVVEVAHHLPIF